MDTNKGTPKSLIEAIQNAFMEPVGLDKFPEHIENHVRDFLSQKFTTANLRMTNWHDGASTRYTPEEILQALQDDVFKSREA